MPDRLKNYFSFKTQGGVLFTTNIAARGLHIPNVDIIIQVMAPEDMATYIHRVGRTSRMGKAGRAILLLRPFEQYFVDKLISTRVKLSEMKILPAKRWNTRLHDSKKAIQVMVTYLSYYVKYIKHHVNLTAPEHGADFVALAKFLGVKEFRFKDFQLKKYDWQGDARDFEVAVPVEEIASDEEEDMWRLDDIEEPPPDDCKD